MIYATKPKSYSIGRPDPERMREFEDWLARRALARQRDRACKNSRRHIQPLRRNSLKESS